MDARRLVRNHLGLEWSIRAAREHSVDEQPKLYDLLTYVCAAVKNSFYPSFFALTFVHFSPWYLGFSSPVCHLPPLHPE